MARQPKGELVPVVIGFNYDPLEATVAEQTRSSADRIRERVKKTVQDIIEVGSELLAVKEALTPLGRKPFPDYFQHGVGPMTEDFPKTSLEGRVPTPVGRKTSGDHLHRMRGTQTTCLWWTPLSRPKKCFP